MEKINYLLPLRVRAYVHGGLGVSFGVGGGTPCVRVAGSPITHYQPTRQYKNSSDLKIGI